MKLVQLTPLGVELAQRLADQGKAGVDVVEASLWVLAILRPDSISFGAGPLTRTIDVDELIGAIISAFKQADETREEVGEEVGMDDLLFLTVAQVEEVLRKHLTGTAGDEEERPS